MCSGVDGDPQGTQLQRELQGAVWPGREGEKKNVKAVSDSVTPVSYYSPWNSPGQDTGVGSLSLLQGISPTKGQNLGLPHCTWILHQLSHKGSPRILRWVAYPFARGSSRPRNRTRASCIADGFFTNGAIMEAPGQQLPLSQLLPLPSADPSHWLNLCRPLPLAEPLPTRPIG